MPAFAAPAFAALLAHEVTAIWDVAYAEQRREVSPSEQHVHSFLEVGPLMATILLSVLHWDQVLALFGRVPTKASFAFRPKQKPLGRGYVRGVLGAILLTGVIPYAEELWRCWRVRPTLAASPAPRDSAVLPSGERNAGFAWTATR